MDSILHHNIFREYDIRGIAARDLAPEAVALISKAIGTFFRKNGAKRIAVGFDCRESSPRIYEILTQCLTAAGCDVFSVRMVPTPVLYYAVHTGDIEGGVMITGSHNPPEHNGFKICLGRDALCGPQIREIYDIAAGGKFASGKGNLTTLEIMDDYCDAIVSGVTLNPRPLRVCVDAGNGMGGVTAVPIYRRLGAVELKGLFTDPDPQFPNHHPDPTVPENLVHLTNAVLESKADIGLAFDGDGDRIGVVDDTGRTVWGDELLALFSRYVLKEFPGSTIIAEVKCSQTLFDEIEGSGGTPIMWKAGHSLIKARMKVTGALLAGEMSGHIFFADRFFGFDDAVYAGARLLEILSHSDRRLSELLSDFPKLRSTPEIRIECPDEIKFQVVEAIIKEFEDTHEINRIDGARIRYADGWGLVRPSNTQELIILRFEADTPERVAAIRREIEQSVNRIIRRMTAS